ncbi:transcriptional regulator, ArsR family [Pirellula staleyi DSM 6068]|uniref:Transcriptional regulator, ArsR family n=1 Tax=Pirellula staleyi (strain ATCC 27377 / DSM 6068 / ICPB 4128) TaxID=530564 RepID=D2R8U0_PIRSD|nr:metalloregulator ArsR/SmtB family transcription factor [Pirellula staleyi]ADB19390.1 transcriptional regulator, ArsR family [Pirellula staleyi DSM 6068]
MPSDTLSLTFAALADPTRRAILARLKSGKQSVGDLARPFKMSLPAISKHLKVLEKSGLITRDHEAQFRRCQLRTKPLEQVSAWIQSYQQHWEESFERLEIFLTDATPQPTASSPKKGNKNVRKK